MSVRQPGAVALLLLASFASIVHGSVRLTHNSGKPRGLHGQCLDTLSVPALTPTETHSPVIDLKWLDKNDLKVVALTKKVGGDVGGFWVSQDGAKTWVEKTQMLSDALAGAKEQLEVVGVFAQKSSPNNVVIVGSGTYMWVSNDFGQTVTAKQTPTKWRGSGIKSMKLHPWFDNWLLVLVKRPDCKNLDHVQIECPHDLMLTQDLFGAMTWTNLTENSKGKIAAFVDFDWGMSLCPSFDNKPHPACMMIKNQTILATMYQKPGDYDQPWDKDVHFAISEHLFTDFSIRVHCGNMFEVIGTRLYMAFANTCPTDINGNSRSTDGQTFKGITLYTSSDGGQNWVQGCLPVALKQEGYELLSTHDGTGALVIVDFMINNGYMDIPASSVYSAGPHHAIFSLSLTDVYRADFGFSTDFARIEGLPGVYIANQMVPRFDGSDYYDIQDAMGLPLVETRITFNGGGMWRRIPAPTVYNFPKCNRCLDGTTDCYLHLRGMSTWDSMTSSMPAVYSNPSAPGMVMATGVVATSGMGLEDDKEGTCTWLSNDGGVTWQDVGEGTYIYEYADWGSTVIMAKHPGLANKPATEIRFSTDYGNCWHSVPLTSALLVDNIRIEPDGQRPRVVVHGHACEKASDPLCTIDNRTTAIPGLMYMVDVQLLMGGKMGQCAEPDYEQFTVPTSATDKTPLCILGKVMRFKRRGADKQCFNGPDFKRPFPVNTTCNCTLADVECDYGYMRYGSVVPNTTTMKCNPISKDRMPTCPIVSHGDYTVSSSGRRLAHADVCTGIEALLSDTDGKGNPTGGGQSSGGKKSGHSGAFKFFMTLLGLIVGAGLFVAWWIYLASEAHRDMLRDAASTVSGVCVNAFNSLRDRIRGRPADLNEHDMGYFQPLGEVSDKDAGIFTLK